MENAPVLGCSDNSWRWLGNGWLEFVLGFLENLIGMKEGRAGIICSECLTCRHKEIGFNLTEIKAISWLF